MESNGTMRIPAGNDRAVWQELLRLLEARMFRGELVIIDATHTHPRSFNSYQQLASKHRYQVVCVDFSDVPLEVCEERNQQREPYKIVPPLEMKRMYDNVQRATIPKWITRVAPDELFNALHIAPRDVSNYKAVHHIGDIQGCYSPLVEYFETYGINDDELYVFVGDYLDRGTQNAEVMQWLLANYHRPNFIFIEGNHEAHLRNWTQGMPARSRQFNLATKLELEAAELSPKKVHGFLYGLRELFYYKLGDYTVLVTHGGLAALPDDLAFINSHQLIKGAGAYEDADTSDAAFAASARPGVYQVHGHRNRYSSPLRVNERCFNLEGKVEFGGELRNVTLTSGGFEERSIKSSIDASKVILEPAGEALGDAESVAGLVADLRGNKDVIERPQAGTHISSFNFTRDVFYRKAWDELNVHARGLFVNTAQNIIVARAYEKFFNIGERPETQPDVLARTLTFPVRVCVKENGYLGMVGYDPEANDLLFASKSSLSSEFASWLRSQFDQLAPIGSKVRREVNLLLKADGGRTLVFEAIEPVNDPHIIEHDAPCLVLLDVVKNATRFEAVDEKTYLKIAKLLGCKTKRTVCVLKDADALHSWLQDVQKHDYTYRGTHIEGFVLQDSHAYMLKVKLPWYSFWRQMRTQLERIKAGKKPQMPALTTDHATAEQFIAFMETKTPEAIANATIIDLRREFYNLSS